MEAVFINVELRITMPQTLRGHHGSAVSHINSGVKILFELQCKPYDRPRVDTLSIPERPYVELEDLEIIFNRLHAQVLQVTTPAKIWFPSVSAQVSMLLLNGRQMMGGTPVPIPRRPKFEALGLGPDVPRAFSSLEEARNSLDYHWNTCEQALLSPTHSQSPHLIGPLLEERQQLSIALERWDSAFRAFLRKVGRSLDGKSLQGARTVEISHIFLTIFLGFESYNSEDQTIWDIYCPQFERIVELAALIVESYKEPFNDQGPTYCMDMNIVAPLYAVAHRCRDPVIRRKAVELLYAASCQEGIWESRMTASAAERVIEMEEAGLGTITCCQDLPKWNRVTDVIVQFDGEGRMSALTYGRDPHDPGNGYITEPFKQLRVQERQDSIPQFQEHVVDLELLP